MKKLGFIILLIASINIRAQDFLENSGKEYDFVLSGKRIAVIAADGVDYNEAVDLPGYWKKWGAEVTLVGTAFKLKAHEISLNEKGFFLPQKDVNASVLLDDFDPGEFDMVYFPGGGSPDNLLKGYREKIIDLITTADQAGKIIAAFCHGPIVLIEAKIVGGKTITGEIKVEEAIRANANYIKRIAVADENLITGSYPFIESFAVIVAQKLLGREVEEKFYQDDFEYAIGVAEHFEDKGVSTEDIKQIVREASLTVNDVFINSYKPWKVIAVQNENMKKEIMRTLADSIIPFYNSNTSDSVRIKMKVNNHIKAPCYLLIYLNKLLPDAQIGAYNLNPAEQNRMIGLNAGGFINNLRVAANKIGLGTNMINGFPFLIAENKLNEIVHAPVNMVLAGVIAIGHPSDSTLPQPLQKISDILTIK